MSERQLPARRGEPASRTLTGVRARVCVRVSVSVCTPLSPEAPLSSDGFQQPLSDSCGGGQSGRQPPREPPGAGTGAAAGGGPGALPRPGRRRWGGTSGVHGRPPWTGGQSVSPRVKSSLRAAPVRRPWSFRGGSSPSRCQSKQRTRGSPPRALGACRPWAGCHSTRLWPCSRPSRGHACRPPRRRTFRPPLKGHSRSWVNFRWGEVFLMRTSSAKQARSAAVMSNPVVSGGWFLTCTEATVGPWGDAGSGGFDRGASLFQALRELWQVAKNDDPVWAFPQLTLSMSLAQTCHMAPVNHRKAQKGRLQCAREGQGGTAGHP